MEAGADHADMDKVMDMPAHRAMFSGFLKATEWGTVLVAMLVALLVFAFALGLGWWVGLLAWVVIGVAAGLLLGLGGAWWGAMGASTVVLAIVGGIMALTGAS